MQQTYFLSSNGEDNICFYTYDCPDPKAVVYFCHGMGEHMGRFADFAEYLNQRGIILCGEDHLGHGMSVKSLENLGHISDKDGWKHVLADSAAALRRTVEQYPDIPCFALGFSLGSYILRYVAAVSGIKLAGVSLAGVGTTKVAPEMEKAIMNVLNREISESGVKNRDNNFREFIKHFIADGADGKMDKPSAKRRKPQPGDPDYDPRYGFNMSSSAVMDMVMISHMGAMPENFRLIGSGTPMLIMSGGSDPVGDMGEAAHEIAQEYRRGGVENVEVEVFPGLYHDIIKPASRDVVYPVISRWLEKYIIAD